MATDYPPSLPVVGDRVEVLREEKLCPAEVVKCHSTSEYDVVYEKDGTEGTLVTRRASAAAAGEGRGRQRCKRSQLVQRRRGCA
jgi:hypothetical protein